MPEIAILVGRWGLKKYFWNLQIISLRFNGSYWASGCRWENFFIKFHKGHSPMLNQVLPWWWVMICWQKDTCEVAIFFIICIFVFPHFVFSLFCLVYWHKNFNFYNWKENSSIHKTMSYFSIIGHLQYILWYQYLFASELSPMSQYLYQLSPMSQYCIQTAIGHNIKTCQHAELNSYLLPLIWSLLHLRKNLLLIVHEKMCDKCLQLGKV